MMRKLHKIMLSGILAMTMLFSVTTSAEGHHRPNHAGGGSEVTADTSNDSTRGNGNGRNKHQQSPETIIEEQHEDIQSPLEPPVEEVIVVPAPEEPKWGEDEALLGYYVTGRGWGHSVGMTQWGAKGMADAGYSYKEILHYYYTGVAISKMNTDHLNIRVALSLDIPIAYIMGMGSYQIVDISTNEVLATFNPYTTSSFSYDSGVYVIRNGSTTVTTPNRVKVTGAPSYYHKGIQYLGDFHISNTPKNTVDVVNHLNVETYLRGVVPHEIYIHWPVEVIKAQALAARTYALKNRTPRRHFDLFDTVASQVYKGISVNDARINSLIEATRGEVITYNGALIDALYSASAGGHTIDSGDIWSPTPYLIGKPDPYDNSPYMQNWWSINLSLEELSTKFPEVGGVTGIEILDTKYDRPILIKISGEQSELFLNGYQFRMRIGYDKMFSSTFVIKEIY